VNTVILQSGRTKCNFKYKSFQPRVHKFSKKYRRHFKILNCGRWLEGSKKSRSTNLRCHGTKYSRHGSLASGTRPNLTYAITVAIHQIRFRSAVYHSKSSVFCLSLARHSEHFSKQHSQNGRQSDDGPYCLRERTWIFICNLDER